MRAFFSTGLFALSAILLAGCGTGNGVSGGSGNPVPTVTSKNPSLVDSATDGPTAGDTLKSGKALDAGLYEANKLSFDIKYQSTYQRRPYFKIQKNVLGGYDFTNDSKVTSFGYADQKSSGEAWEKITRDPNGNVVYSVSLWNAGKGARAGVESNENGQSFHKILGYYVADSTGNGTRDRGHFIIGNATDFSKIAQKTKTASYDGYYYTNILPSKGTPPDQALAVSGGLKFVADFQARTISGQSTSFTVREAGASNFNAQNYTLQLGTTAISNNGGGFFSGIMTSDYIWMNGSYTARFYGGNAQEVAGVLSGQTGTSINDGFFTAVVEPTAATTP